MIRKYQAKDKSSVREVCVETAPENLKITSAKREKLLLRYCDYYIQSCANTCLVLEENEKVCGYVLSCESAKKFYKEFVKFSCDKLNVFQRLEFYFDTLSYLPFKNKYPAHLHIDILKEFRRQGNGQKLILALCEELKAQNISGVMLIVGSKNESAIKFYKAVGFETIIHLPGSYALGKKL